MSQPTDDPKPPTQVDRSNCKSYEIIPYVSAIAHFRFIIFTYIQWPTIVLNMNYNLVRGSP